MKLTAKPVKMGGSVLRRPGAIGILPWCLNQIQEDMHVRDLVVDGLL